MNRKLIFLGLIIWAISFCSKAQNKPNILFIAVDDLNDFPSYTNQYPNAITPNMDKLAEEGIVFSKAYCQWPTCGPSRSSIMSGMLPTTIGGKEKLADDDLQIRASELGTKLLHQYFSQYGYKTMAVGKICHHHVPEGSVDVSGGRGPFTAGLGRMGVNYSNNATSTDWAAVEKKDEEFPDYQAADFAIEQLQTKHDKPFMLMVGFLSPHVPWYVNKRWFDLYNKDELTLPPYKKDDWDDLPAISKQVNIQEHMPRTEWAIENDQWRNILHAYLASVSFTDHQLGRVLDALENSIYKDNTIIVLWSDHGYHMGEKNSFQKHSLWDRSGHVPFIFAGPGIKKGLKSDRAVSLLDIYPTLLDLCNLPENNKNEGHSLVPLMKKPNKKWSYPVTTAWRGGNFALQSDRYRYIRYKDGSEELYDHRNDPNEWNNLACNPEYNSIRTKMANELKALNLKETIHR